MLMTSTEVKSILNLSTGSTTYDTLIDTYTPIVLYDMVEYTNRDFTDAYHYFTDDKIVFDSTSSTSNNTISLDSASTENWELLLQSGDTILVKKSWFNNEYYTCSTRSTHVLTVDETIVDENSTDHSTYPIVYKCKFTRNEKRIAAKMIWYNIENSTAYQGDITSESYGNYSVSYGGGTQGGSKGFGLYPASLLSGLKKKARTL